MKHGPSLQKLWCLEVKLKKGIFLLSLVRLMLTVSAALAAFLNYRKFILEVSLHCHLSSSLSLSYGLADYFIVLQSRVFCYHLWYLDLENKLF